MATSTFSGAGPRITDAAAQPVNFVLIGASGDLAWRLIVPALYDLYADSQLPARFRLWALARAPLEDPAIAARYAQACVQRSRHADMVSAKWPDFAQSLRYVQADITQADTYRRLGERLDEQDRKWDARAQRVFYLAIPPTLIAPVARGLTQAGLAADRERARIVVEKPLGRDVESFRAIDGTLREGFSESQIFRIDHFLGKETVQNILAMRFANPIFEPIWNRRYIDHVAITFAETLGVEHRAPYYEHAGALRDMLQNHLLQLMCLVAMEPPVAYDAEDIRNKKIDVLRAVRPIPEDRVPEYAARGQYGPGAVDGANVRAYREETGVSHQSTAETYAALKFHIDNWRWQDVPFYVRTGKRLAAALGEISIRFRDVPHRSFPASARPGGGPVRLVIQLNPEQGIVLKFIAKEPGYALRLQPVDMRFSYTEAFGTPPPRAYETLLRDVLRDDATLFMRADQVEAAWQIVMPVLRAWEAQKPDDFPNYPAGSWGPQQADALLARDGRSWLTPTRPSATAVPGSARPTS